ncbi:zinc finger, CCHC-type containing protein [Tanacetum coccineum]
MKNNGPDNATLDQVRLIIEVEEEAEEEVITPIVVDVVVVVPIKTEMKDEDLQNPRKEMNQEDNLTQKDDEPALLLDVWHEVNEGVFLNEKHLTPKLRNLNEESNTSKVWYLDNGESNHMTGDREKFNDIDRLVQGYVRFGDGLKDKWGTFVGSQQEWKIVHEGKQWLWDETTKFRLSPKSTFTIEGYNQEDTNLVDENDLTSEPLGSSEGINDEEFQPNPQTHVHGDEGLSTPTQSPVTFVGSTSPASSTIGGGAPKRYRLLTDIYEECDRILFMQDADEPTSYLMAIKDREWVKAMKMKRDPSGNILKHKARLVAKGYVQKPRVDFEEVFAPVAWIETIQILLAHASSHGWKVHHLDVKSTFLNGRLEEEVYVTQPKGYMKANHPAKVYKLSKALYGLRKAPRAWKSRLDKFIKGLNLTRFGVYVDDLIVTGNYDGDAKYFKQQMNKEFEMSDMGLLSYYLGIEVTQHEDGITLKQSTYARNDKGGVLVNPTLFRSIIEGLRYLTHTRPDIAYDVGIVSRFMEKPTIKHMQAVKRILRYIRGRVDYGLVYTKYHKGDVITRYSDSNHVRNVEDRRSTCRMAEFMAATTTTYQGIWVSRLVHEIIGKKAGLFMLYLDNKSAIELIKNLMFHGRSKHIDLRYHFIREWDVVIKYVCSKE